MNDFSTARDRIGGLKGVIKLLGDGPGEDRRWKSMTSCPFCGMGSCAGVFDRGGVDFFKCLHSDCSSGGKVMTEVGYIAMRLGLSREKPAGGGPSPAYQKFLQMAGCWVEPSRVNGQPPTSHVCPTESNNAGSVGTVVPTLGESMSPDSNNAVHAPASPQLAAFSPPAGQQKENVEERPELSEIDPSPPPKTTPESDPPNPASSDLPAGLAVLREFFKKLQPTHEQLNPEGNGFKRETLLDKRGLTQATCEALGFRANPREGNEKNLLELQEKFTWKELRASGLWLEADQEKNLERRMNTQFCGKGQVGRKPEHERKNDNDKYLWGWCEPVLIPYFNERGELIKLRPHKGGASTGTIAGQQRIYVPRDFRYCASTVEKFFTVVVCEGEYKAAAVWQTIGGGRANGRDPVGVCAIPGISFARNIEVREDLEMWLKAVGCQRLIVAFDDEDKSDKPMRQRHDAQKYARYLAIYLGKKLHLAGLVVTLPKKWRNANGKADWDGALAMLLKGSSSPESMKLAQEEFEAVLDEEVPTPHLNASDVQEITTAGAAQGQYSQPFSPKSNDWEQGLKYMNRSGIRVRSKIEKIMADCRRRHAVAETAMHQRVE